MSLKDWMKKVETAQLNEFAPPTGSVMVPGMQGQGQVDPTFITPTKPNDKATQGILAALAKNKNIAVINKPGQTQNGTDTTNTNTSGTTTQTVGGTTQVSETGLDQVNSFHDEIQVESKPRTEISDGLRYIKDNYKHECKMYEDGWGLDESMYSALVDHYYHEGKIPRKLMIEGGQALREFIEGCYAKDTGMGGNQDAINNGTLEEEDFSENTLQNNTLTAFDMNPDLQHRGQFKGNKPSRLGSAMGKVGNAMKTVGGKVMDKLHPPDEKLRSGPLGPLDEEMSPLERSLRQSTKEKEMFESKKTRSVQEATEKTKTGLKHKADAGGYGRVDDEEDTDSDGKKIKKVAKDEPKKGRGRPKKSDNASGEDKKFDFGALSKTSGSKAPASDKWDKKKTTSHKIATKADREEIDEGETIEKKGGRVHKGSYGTSHEAGDEGVKKVVTQRGRGRPKKDADDSGEVKNYDWSAFGAKKGVKLPAWDKKKTTTHKIATKADREEVDEAKLKGKQSKLDINKNGKLEKSDFAMLRGKKKKDAQMESWERQLKGLLIEGMPVPVSTSTGQADGGAMSITSEDAGKLLQILQNAGLSVGTENSPVVSPSAAPAQVSTNSTSPSTGSSGDSAANADLNGSGSAVATMPMPRGMAFSVQPAETEIPTAPPEVNVSDSEDVFNQLGKDHAQSGKSDNGDNALALLKKSIGHSAELVDNKQTPTAEGAKDKSKEEKKKVDESKKSSKPDYEDKDSPYHMGGEYDNVDQDDEDEEDSKEDKKKDKKENKKKSEKVDEGKETCNECGGLMEDDHKCETQLNEWSNSPQGQSEDEQFKTELEFMQNIISGGLNKRKVDQTVMPHTRVKIAESKVNGISDAYTLELKKLAGI
jgi:hypothetical protein